MKILGIMPDKGFIVEVAADEMAQLMGTSSSMYVNSSDFREMTVGKNVKLGSCYSNAQEILGFYQSIKSSVSSMKTSATKILDYISSKENPIAAKIVKEQ